MPPRRRTRYVAFVAEGSAPAQHEVEAAVLAALRRALPRERQEAARLRVFPAGARADAGIVRCNAANRERVVAALRGLELGAARLRTVATSGTLRGARRALGGGAMARPRGASAGPRTRGREPGTLK